MKLKIGGMDHVVDMIENTIFNTRSLSFSLICMLKIKHTKGILLHGPPGTGKSYIAAQIASFYPYCTIINGP